MFSTAAIFVSGVALNSDA